MKPTHLLVLAVTVCSPLLAAEKSSTPGDTTERVEYRWPDDANIIDVKRDFGAKGDGKTDDTEALKAAIRKGIGIDGQQRQRQMVYLPAGTYLVSEPLKARVNDEPDGEGGWSDGWRAGLFICGENRDTTIIQLKDNCPGFQKENIGGKKGEYVSGVPVLSTGSTAQGSHGFNRTGGFGNEAFENTLMNFTIDTGKGNPGASGVDCLISNRGTMEEVTVRSGDGQGVTGLVQTRIWPGPGLLKNITVEGFDYGLAQRSMDCSMTYENITFRNQNKIVVHGIGSAFMTMRHFDIEGGAQPYVFEGNNAIITILDSTAKWTGKGKAPAAIQAEGYLTLKDVSAEGYSAMVAPLGKPKSGNYNLPIPANGTVDFFTAKEPTRALPGSNEIPNLPIKETPRFHHSDFSKWANPRDFEKGSRTAGIQEAIDSGAEIIYFPHGDYVMEEMAIVRGSVRKLIGMEADISLKGESPGRADFVPVLRLDKTESGMVFIEHLAFERFGILHNSDDTIVARKCNLKIQNTINGTGDVFLEDGMFKADILFPLNLWARQYNAEFGERAQITLRHATAWLLGMKVEGHQQAVLNIGSTTEIWGLYSMTGKGDSTVGFPYIENREGWLVTPFREGGQGSHAIRWQDTFNGKMANNKTISKKWPPRECNLFIAGEKFDPQAEVPAAPTAVSAEAADGTAVVKWTAPKAGKFPLAYFIIDRDGETYGTVEADQPTVFTDPDTKESTSYSYSVRAVNLRGGISPASTVAKTTTAADTTAPNITEVRTIDDDTSVVLIDFDEPMAAATSIDSYRLEPSVPIEGVSITVAGTRVALRMAEPLKDGTKYTLTTSGLKDASAKGNTVTNPSHTFTPWLMGDGLKAEFWDNVDFSGKPVITKTDEKIDYWWGDKSPDLKIPHDNFSCRWTGTLRPKIDGEHEFSLRVAGRKRLTINGETVIDRMEGKGGSEESSGKMKLEAGKQYEVTVETAHPSGGAGSRFYWKQPSAEKRSHVNASYLFSGSK